jgi:hypothetical protein
VSAFPVVRLPSVPEILPPELDDLVTVLQLRAQWEVQFQGRGESSWSFVMLRTALVDQQQGLWELWRDNVKPFWMARRPPEWHFTRVLVEDRWPQVKEPLEISIDEYGPPGAFNGAPVQLSPILTLYSTYRGRSYRGRTFWGQMRVEDLEGSNITNDLWNALNSWADAMIDTFGAGPIIGVDPVLAIVSRQHNGVPEPKGRYAVVDRLTRRRYIALQRRRNRYWMM